MSTGMQLFSFHRMKPHDREHHANRFLLERVESKLEAILDGYLYDLYHLALVCIPSSLGFLHRIIDWSIEHYLLSTTVSHSRAEENRSPVIYVYNRDSQIQ